eukprot:CFRG8472T1
MTSNWAQLQQQLKSNSGVSSRKSPSVKQVPKKKKKNGTRRDTVTDVSNVNCVADLKQSSTTKGKGEKRIVTVDDQQQQQQHVRKKKKYVVQELCKTDEPTKHTVTRNIVCNNVRNGDMFNSTSKANKNINKVGKRNKKKNTRSRTVVTQLTSQSIRDSPMSATKAPPPFVMDPASCYANRRFITPRNCVCTKSKRGNPEVVTGKSNGSSVSVCKDTFAKCMYNSYRGFAINSSSELDAELHDRVVKTLDDMVHKDYFHYDVVSAGKAVSSTFVKRTLVGDRGMTYHYQRLRIFAHPWDDSGVGNYSVDADNTTTGDGQLNKQRSVSTGGLSRTSDGRFANLMALCDLNNALISNAEHLLVNYHSEAGVGSKVEKKGGNYSDRIPRGSCRYSVSLINYMFSANKSQIPLKDEVVYGMGPTSVSWHADSSLQDYSTIAVYQITGNGDIASSQCNTERSTKESKHVPDQDDWQVAMRVIADDITPAVAVSLKSGETYYMMDDFNHHHHHAVIAPSGKTANERNGWRFSSTHRVAVTVKDTYDYIVTKAADILATVQRKITPPTVIPLTASDVQAVGHLHIELEFEWVRMFWLQGTAHAQSHTRYWLGCIRVLTQYLEQCEAFLALVVDVLGGRLHPEDGRSIGICKAGACMCKDLRTYAMTIYILKEIRFRRRENDKRVKSPAYHYLVQKDKPVECLRYEISFEDISVRASGDEWWLSSNVRESTRARTTLPRDLSLEISTMEAKKRELFGSS